jgi:hypothetical protein
MVAEQWASGRRQLRRNPNDGRPRTWQPEHDAALSALAGAHDVGTIARILTERFGQPRSEAAVKHRLLRLGISRMTARPLSSTEVGRIFGISRETVRTRFVGPGLLVGTVRRGGRHGVRMFELSEVAGLIREHPDAYDAARIRDGALASLARAATRHRRLRTADVERICGIDHRTQARYYGRGLVPSAQKVRRLGPGAGGTWTIEQADLETVRALGSVLAARRLAASEARRDPLSGAFLPGGCVPSSELRCTIRTIDRADALGRLVAGGAG